MGKRIGFFVAFIFIFGTGGFIAYLFGDVSPNASLEHCNQYCKPNKGFFVQEGFHIGPDWRYSSQNAVCKCKAP